MFLGELGCLIAFFISHWIRKRMWKRRQLHQIGTAILIAEEEPRIPKFNPIIFLAPACCDILATSLFYVGLTLTTASSAIMLRGAVIIFTGVLSILFLKQRLQGFKWFGMVF